MGASSNSPSDLYYSDMVIWQGGHTSKFKLHPRGDGFDDWEADDGHWLSMSSGGWAYRSYYAQRVGWKIVDGKLYNNYWNPAKWQDYPKGCRWDGFSGWYGYFVGVKDDSYTPIDPDDSLQVLTNCELIQVP